MGRFGGSDLVRRTRSRTALQALATGQHRRRLDIAIAQSRSLHLHPLVRRGDQHAATEGLAHRARADTLDTASGADHPRQRDGGTVR